MFVLPLGQRNVIVTAHPDDETLWCGGLPLRFPELEWTVICCSITKRDPPATFQFFDACKVLGVEGRLLPFTETSYDIPLTNLDLIDLSGYDCIITHGADGEYGHPHHRSVNAHIFKTWKHKLIVSIGYKHGQQEMRLSQDELGKKRKALSSYNGPSPGVQVPKWQAVIKTYCKDGFALGVEHYDVHVPNA